MVRPKPDQPNRFLRACNAATKSLWSTILVIFVFENLTVIFRVAIAIGLSNEESQKVCKILKFNEVTGTS